MEFRTTCQECGGYKTHTVPDEFDPPNSYEPALKARAATEKRTPAEIFAEQWKAERLAALEAEPGQVAALRTAHKARVSTLRLTELSKYEPPDIYRIALARMKGMKADDNDQSRTDR
jgi:rRNA maturation protein Nop10